MGVVGTGQEGARPRAALPSNVKMLGQVSDQELPGLYHGARALIFTADEDFGIAPLEAQAAGRPVIALRRGGALEPLTPHTGLFSYRPTPHSLPHPLHAFHSCVPDPLRTTHRS